MRIAVAAITGVLLALLTSYGIQRVASSSSQDPVTKPLYNYGTR